MLKYFLMSYTWEALMLSSTRLRHSIFDHLSLKPIKLLKELI